MEQRQTCCVTQRRAVRLAKKTRMVSSHIASIQATRRSWARWPSWGTLEGYTPLTRMPSCLAPGSCNASVVIHKYVWSVKAVVVRPSRSAKTCLFV